MMTTFSFQAATALPLEDIRAKLAALPTARRDRWDEAVYIVADDAATLKYVEDARESSREGYPRVVSLVRLYTDHVDFSLQTTEVETARNLARWIRASCQVAILNESFKDISANCDANLDFLFGKPRMRRVVPVGFFFELKHGRANGPSLRAATREKGRPGESRIAAYLRTAPILLHALGPVKDVFEPKGDFIGAPNIRTDGVYAWPEDLGYYVERYHVALPDDFLSHLAAAKWTAPIEVDTSAVEVG